MLKPLKKPPPVTQQDLRIMIDEWMNNPVGDGMEQRLVDNESILHI